MRNELANLEDLRRLGDREYSLSIVDAFLVVNDVFYVDGSGALQKGRLAAPLNLITPETLGAPVSHQMYWSGSPPHYADGGAIPLGSAAVNIEIGGVTYLSHLSNKPTEGFAEYTPMVEHYVALIAGPAEQKFKVCARTGATYDVPESNSPFKVEDTLSTRAEITDLNRRIAGDKVALIGLGGTGGFVLDFLVKSAVASIDAYDFDAFKVHNGFRLPGEVPLHQFGQPKSEIFKTKYDSFRHHIAFHTKRVEAGDEALFEGITFAFVCIDDGEARAVIWDLLIGLGIPFIDTGMGVEKEGGKLDGLIRTTLVTPETAAKAKERVTFDNGDADGAYRVFVQLAELNALNAAFAVMRYKQFREFFADDENFMETLISIGSTGSYGVS